MSRKELRDKIVRVLQRGGKTVTEIQRDVGLRYSKKEIEATLVSLSRQGIVVKMTTDHTNIYALNKI